MKTTTSRPASSKQLSVAEKRGSSPQKPPRPDAHAPARASARRGAEVLKALNPAPARRVNAADQAGKPTDRDQPVTPARAARNVRG
jgi:hypothetical protein